MFRKALDLDSAMFGAVAARKSRPGDSLFPLISQAANHSLLWVAIAFLLATFGGRRGKRAAGRGLASIGLTSLTVSQVIKRFVRRPRPPIRNVPLVRQVKTLPLTTSFPSGHAASAFAFTTAVMMEWPAIGRLISPLAAGVAYSRIHVGVHYPGDVVAGALIGTGIANLTRLQFPTIPPDGRTGAATDDLKMVETKADGAGLHVYSNPDSGSAVGFDHSGPLAIGLPDAQVFSSEESEDLPETLERIADGASAIAASGGDGTIGAAALVATERDLPLMVLPGGTLNHLARDLRIHSVADSIDAYQEGRAVEIDLAQIGGISFINTATLGGYPEMIEMRENLQNRIGRWPAHVLSVLRTISRAEPMKVKINGNERTIWMAFIGNCAHEPAGFAPGWRPCMDDGKLDLRILHGERPFARPRLLLSILAGRLASSAAYERHLVEEIEIVTGRDSIPVTRDGDHCEIEGDFRVIKRPKCLTVFAPHE